MYLFFGIFIIICVFSYLLNYWRKRRIRRKICRMEPCEKLCLLNKLFQPFGFIYDAKQDTVTSTIDAWQRNFGYRAAYDRTAAFYNMVFDCMPVYFDYDGRTWLIEFWKGQYGINTGGEIGVYRAEKLLSPKQYAHTQFQSVPDEWMLPMTMNLTIRNGRQSCSNKCCACDTQGCPNECYGCDRQGCPNECCGNDRQDCSDECCGNDRQGCPNKYNDIDWKDCSDKCCGCDTQGCPDECCGCIRQGCSNEYNDIDRQGCPDEGVDSLFSLGRLHWWLTGFRMGRYCEPGQLALDVSLTFPDEEMLQSFVNGLIHTGYDRRGIYVHTQTVFFSFTEPHASRPGLPCRMIRRISQWENRQFCRLFLRITRPFSCTPDRLLYLYYYLPFAFRHTITLYHFGHKSRRRHS